MNIARELLVVLEQRERYRFNRSQKFFFVKRGLLKRIDDNDIIAADRVCAMQEVCGIELKQHPEKLFSIFREEGEADV